MSPLFPPTILFPPDALDSDYDYELDLSDNNQNGLKHQTYTNFFKGSPET